MREAVRGTAKRDMNATTTGDENENDETSATGRVAAGTQRGPPTGKPITRLFRAAGQTLLDAGDGPQPDEPKKRRDDGDGEFQTPAAKFSRHLKARRLKRLRTAARKCLPFVRIIRLSRKEWGAPDA